MRFRDRSDAGRRLAALLSVYAGRGDVVVLGLPRGGVAVAYEVAKALGAPLDVFLVRKLGTPGQEELAMGAIASGDVVVLNESVVDALDIPRTIVDEVIETKRAELVRCEQLFRQGGPAVPVRDQCAILVDDGLATGASMCSAVAGLRKQHPSQIVVAAPVSAEGAAAKLGREADRLVCAAIPEPFYGVGQWYEDFHQVTDDEVGQLLASAAEWGSRPAGDSRP